MEGEGENGIGGESKSVTVGARARRVRFWITNSVTKRNSARVLSLSGEGGGATSSQNYIWFFR